MNVVVLHDHKRQALEQQQDAAFNEYAALARKAQATMNISDAIAAGKAWSRFIYLFCGAPQ